MDLKVLPKGNIYNFAVAIGTSREFEVLISDLLTIANPNNLSDATFYFENNGFFLHKKDQKPDLSCIIDQIILYYKPKNLASEDYCITIYDKDFHILCPTARQRINYRNDITTRLLKIGIVTEDIDNLFLETRNLYNHTI